MVSTKTRAKAGTTEYYALAVQQIPLDDPEKEGNMGLVGFDGDGVSRTFKSKAAAVRWLKDQAKTLPHMIQGEIRENFWEADSFEDDVYGLVLDAIEVTRHEWNFWVEPDGTLRPDGEWSP